MVFHFVLITFISTVVQALHYKGGTITWKPTDPYTNASTVELTISESHWWNLEYSDCNANIIHNQLWYGDYRTGTVGPPLIECLSGCSGTGWSNINNYTKCTDFSETLEFSSGSLIVKRTLNRNTNMVIGYWNGAWADEIRTNAGGNPGDWRVVTKIDLSQKYPINSSPVTGSLPIIRVISGRVAVIQIPAADWDVADDVRCRWANKTGTAGDECVDLCQNLPGAAIGPKDCTITWNAVLRNYDTTRGYTTSTYLAAVMVEDFLNTATTTAMSAVPLQMLVFVYTPASGACNVTPAIIGDRPNRACIGVPIGVLLTERIVATVYCSGNSIKEFLTASPLFMNKTTIAPVSGVPNQWFITLRWTPTVDQKGPQVFCAAPIDQKGLTGSQHCINFVVGYAAPNLITPLFVQGSASPLGTVLSNHSIFTIQATSGVYHPNRNGTYVQIFNRANTTMPEWEADCGYSPNCIYTGSTVLFHVQNANWKYGAHYYILLSSGTASGNVFCAPESAPITDPSFWNFNIWDPGLSSTTSSSTTPPTTGTVTTRSLATTTPIANLTTTGIVITTPTTQTTTTLTTTTTSTTETTTSGTTTTATTTLPPVNIISATDFVEQCKQPVAIMNAVTMGVMAVVNVLGMFTMFTKLDKMFNPSRIAAKVRQQKFRNRIAARR